MDVSQYVDAYKNHQEELLSKKENATQAGDKPTSPEKKSVQGSDFEVVLEGAEIKAEEGQPEVFETAELEPTELEAVGPVNAMGLVELILKKPGTLHRMIRDPKLKADLIPRFLTISLVGFLFYGVAMSMVIQSTGTWPKLTSVKDSLNRGNLSLITFPGRTSHIQMSNKAKVTVSKSVFKNNPWFNGSALKLIIACCVGLIAATGVCLPSLYFYSLLAGIKMSMLDVTIHALKSKATAAVALIGILPIYAAISMGMVIFGADAEQMTLALILGLFLPFAAGFWGTASLHQGVATLCDTLPPERRERRACFLRRLVFSWSACYTAITPIMIFTLWEAMAN